jgi:hypothetical protein
MKCGLSFASRKLSPLVASAKPESERATTVACEKSHKSFWEGTASAVPTLPDQRSVQEGSRVVFLPNY